MRERAQLLGGSSMRVWTTLVPRSRTAPQRRGVALERRSRPRPPSRRRPHARRPQALLSSDATIEIVGEASEGPAALEQVRSAAPAVVLMDVRMPHLDGISATRDMPASSPEVKVLILTTFEPDDYIFGTPASPRPRALDSHQRPTYHEAHGGSEPDSTRVRPTEARAVLATST
jgi:CheY-like chemotaxis protein